MGLTVPVLQSLQQQPHQQLIRDGLAAVHVPLRLKPQGGLSSNLGIQQVTHVDVWYGKPVMEGMQHGCSDGTIFRRLPLSCVQQMAI